METNLAETNTKTNPKTSPKDKKLGRGKTIILQIIILTGWVSLAMAIATAINQWVFAWMIQTFNLGTGTLIQSIFSTCIYVVALLLCFCLPKHIIATFKRKKSEKTADLELGENSRESLGLKGTPTWTDILLSPIGFIAQFLLSLVVVSAFTIFPWFNATQEQETGYSDLITPQDKVLAFVVICVIAPIIEEIIFRGFLYGKLRENLNFGKKHEKLNLPIAILITSLLFGIMHGQWNVGVNVFCASIILCILRELTGTIYCGMLVHIFKNALAFWLLFIVK